MTTTRDYDAIAPIDRYLILSDGVSGLTREGSATTEDEARTLLQTIVADYAENGDLNGAFTDGVAPIVWDTAPVADDGADCRVWVVDLLPDTGR